MAAAAAVSMSKTLQVRRSATHGSETVMMVEGKNQEGGKEGRPGGRAGEASERLGIAISTVQGPE